MLPTPITRMFLPVESFKDLAGELDRGVEL